LNLGQLYTIPGYPDKIDGVDAIAAAALCVIDDTIEDREPSEIGVLADLVRLVAELGDVETTDRGRKTNRRLPWLAECARRGR
jgi:hypothetical protein